MERIRDLNRYQKAIIIIMVIMVLAFSVIYPVTMSRAGFEYKGAILVPAREDGGTVYSGRLNWQQARFTVSEDKTVLFYCGDKTYGPYTAKEDPSAIPKDDENAQYMTGVELRCKEEILFRGGVWDTGDFRFLYNEDGTPADVGIYAEVGGIARDENGNIIDPLEPSPGSILELMAGPKLKHKGQWPLWAGGAALCILNALSILFADELFRWQLSFSIRDPDRAQPSDWELGTRYIGWTVLAAMALVFFIRGLL